MQNFPLINKLLRLAPVLFLVSCGHSYYVVRHAEKAQPSTGLAMSSANNPLLSAEGQNRAQALGNVLKNKKIRHIYSTNTIRTLSTAEPLSKLIGVKPVVYGNVDSALIRSLKTLKSNTLVVGHSNTIDDIVNGLASDKKVNGDLGDEEYDNLYVVKLWGKKARFKALKFGR